MEMDWTLDPKATLRLLLLPLELPLLLPRFPKKKFISYLQQYVV